MGFHLTAQFDGEVSGNPAARTAQSNIFPHNPAIFSVEGNGRQSRQGGASGQQKLNEASPNHGIRIDPKCLNVHEAIIGAQTSVPQTSVPQRIRVGDIIETSYGSGPFLVKSVSTSPWNRNTRENFLASIREFHSHDGTYDCIYLLVYDLREGYTHRLGNIGCLQYTPDHRLYSCLYLPENSCGYEMNQRDPRCINPHFNEVFVVDHIPQEQLTLF
jgi:hypothetical protein